MKVFVAGATGAVGRRLLPELVGAGHSVVAMTRSQTKADALRALGAEPVTADGLNAAAVTAAMREAQPDAVIHQLTALSGDVNLRKFDAMFEQTNRLRTEGLDHLLAAAREVGAHRFIAQSFAGWTYARQGGPVKSEDDPLDPNPPANQRRTLDAIRYLEQALAGSDDIEGIALRYGGFYGPGTSLGADGEMTEAVRRRRFPIVGDGAGIWSFIHVDDVAGATVAALERGRRGVYNIVDDEPAPVSDWLPYLARTVGAKPPRRVPVWVGRLAIGEVGVSLMTRVRGASNDKAKRELQWSPRWASWREGFRHGLDDGGRPVTPPGERSGAR